MKYVTLILLMLSGCATAPTSDAFDVKMRSWVGSTTENLVSRFGIPLKEMDLNANTKLLEYELGSGVTTAQTFYGATMASTASCRVTFSATDGIIKAYRWSGNSCVSN